MSWLLPPVPQGDLSAEQASLLAEWQLDRGQITPPGELWRVLLRSPAAMRAVGKLGAFARTATSLPETLRLVGVFAVVWQRGYAFEIAIQERNLAAAGVPRHVVEAVRQRDYQNLPDGIRTVARLAYGIADAGTVDARTAEAALVLLGDQALVELAVVAAYFAMVADLAAALSS